VDGKIKSLEEIYLFSLPIKEFKIIDLFLVPGNNNGDVSLGICGAIILAKLSILHSAKRPAMAAEKRPLRRRPQSHELLQNFKKIEKFLSKGPEGSVQGCELLDLLSHSTQ
jgi:hypothetical protein